ncbi:MAG: DUF3108 domain-containing protein [Candidatus Stygibacter frigidus]|nr:DUF3108 domain-containing protein [Candidatus Stygibacter frigidus]
MSIRYLGFKVVKVDMIDCDSVLTVTAKASGFGSIANRMDNQYQINYFGEFLPNEYRKIIYQKDYTENRIIGYDRINLKADRKSLLSKELDFQYPIMPESRDFFSALYYIRTHLKNHSPIYLDANSLIWKADFQVVDKEDINTVLGKQSAFVVEVKFKKISQTTRQRSDMLTNNLVNEDNVLSLWISDTEDRLPLKARYNMKPFSVYWILDTYE